MKKKKKFGIDDLIFDPDWQGVMLGMLSDWEGSLLSMEFYHYAYDRDGRISIRFPWTDKDIRLFKKRWPYLWNYIFSSLRSEFPNRYEHYRMVKLQPNDLPPILPASYSVYGDGRIADYRPPRSSKASLSTKQEE